MRISLIDTDYPAFVEYHHRSHPELETAPYAYQLEKRRRAWFGVLESYRRELETLGHAVDDIYMSDPQMNRAWAKENDARLAQEFRPWHWRMRRSILPAPSKGPGKVWMTRFLRARVKSHSPDALLVLDMTALDPVFLADVKKESVVVAGQHAATSLRDVDTRPYDVIFSSFRPTIDELTARGNQARYVPLAFDATLLEHFKDRDQERSSVTFVGSLAPVHGPRRLLLREMAEQVPNFSWWSPEPQLRRQSRALRDSYRGPAWGLAMYRVLAESLVTINHHGDIAPYANNLRLFEATGMGAALLTDARRDLENLFDIGTEVMTYDTVNECVGQALSLVNNPRESRELGRRGQLRTLQDHTWSRRIPAITSALETFQT